MLTDKDIKKLCHGRIIKASFYGSSGKDAAGPHYAVILDADTEIQEHDDYFVAVISHNDNIEKEFIMPVPGYTGLKGFIVGSWTAVAHLPRITEVGSKLLAPEMVKVLKMVREASAAKGAQAARNR
jgi:hypothetical protein